MMDERGINDRSAWLESREEGEKVPEVAFCLFLIG